MATITVRNVPESVVDRLKDRARRHHRSMEQEVRVILSERVPDKAETLRAIESLWGKMKRQVTPEEAEGWVRRARQWR